MLLGKFQAGNGLAKVQPLNIYLILPVGVQCDDHDQQNLHRNTEDGFHPKAQPIQITFTPLACYQNSKEVKSCERNQGEAPPRQPAARRLAGRLSVCPHHRTCRA